jgi:hypothetical protein
MRLPSTIIQLALACALLLIRVPSLAQPMGGDQALYAYVGDAIRGGGLPYRDAWDQKPPAIHFLYAGLRTIWADDGVVALADLLAAAAIAWLLFRVASGFSRTSAAAGSIAALLFVLLSNPSFTRLGGIRLRAQCETFIAVLLVGALLSLVKTGDTQTGQSTRLSRLSVPTVSAGVLFGLAFTFKYNVAIFAVAGVVTLWLWNRLTLTHVLAMALGFCIPVLAMLTVFALGGALGALYDATILYNLRYSGETYAGPLDVVRYLTAFPIERARVDALWTVGGAGCLILIASALTSSERRERVVPVVWVAAACLSIAINGSRSLPQYFIQANPFLALAAGWGTVVAWNWIKATLGPMAKLAAVGALILVAVGVWRVNQFPKLVEQTLFDARRLSGQIARDEYLARYDDDRKYSAIAGVRLGEYLRERSQPDQRVYVFGFTSSAYLHAQRASASRFFWSRPVIAGFKEDDPTYGANGVLSELNARTPAIVALQHHDWAPDVADSRAFFLATPALATWLQDHYRQVSDGPNGFDIWVRSVTP